MSVFAPFVAQITAPGQPLEVTTETIDGSPQRTFVNRPDHLSFLIGIGLAHGDREFLVQEETRLTYEQAMTRSLRLAGGLIERFGVRPGDRIGILGSNAPDWVVAFWAVIAFDGVAVPYNAWWKPAELSFGIEDSETQVVLTDVRRAEVAIEAGMDPSRVIVWGGGLIPDGTVRFDDLLAKQALDFHTVERRGEDAPAGIFYTSGTTGSPKGSANTHRNLITNLLNAAAMLGAVTLAGQAEAEAAGEPVVEQEETQDIDLTVIPMFHATALMSTMIPYVYGGHKLVFMPPGRFDPHAAADLIERERATRFGGVPTIVARIIDERAYEGRDFSSVTSISYGGAPSSPALLARIETAFPNLTGRVIQGYGLTETSPLLTLNIGPDYHDHPDSVGVAVPTVELKIADPDGNDLTTGATGEIWARGANIIPGYWNRPDVNAETFVDGFFRTGDVGHLDEAGFLYITDRAKDMVIRGGENVYCVEVEAVLDACPGVLEAAVIGVPHDELGEEVKAVVVVEHPGDVSAFDLHEYAAERLAPFKVPTHWDITTERLPRNPSGKVLKPALRHGHSAVFAVGEETDSAL